MPARAGLLSRLSRNLATLLVAAALAACGGTSSNAPPYALPQELIVEDGHEALLDDLGDGALEARIEAIREIVTRRFVVEPERQDLEDGLALVTWSLLQGDQRVRHIAIVSEGPWTVERENTLLSAALDAPGGAGGAPVFHIVGSEPAPYSVRYLFGNDWWAALESQLFVLLSQGDPDDAAPFVAGARAILAEFGVEADAGRSTAAELDRLLRAIPAADPASDYRPVATLAGIGLVLGQAMCDANEGLTWVPAEDAMAEFYALEVGWAPGSVLRPIDYVMRAWRSDATAPLEAYNDVVGARLRTLRQESP